MNRRLRIINGPFFPMLGLGIMGLAALWGNARLIHERRALRTELATLRSEPLPLVPGEDASVAREITKLADELAQETALLETSAAELAGLQNRVPAVENEELRS